MATSMSHSRGASRKNSYIKLRKLGEGAFGSAFLVQKRQSKDTTKFVMKEVICKNKDDVIDALREMVTLRILQCPWVVTYVDFFQDNLSVYLVMEYCPGGDLYTEMNAALKNGQRIPEATIMRWFTQMTLGLNEIHSRQFMHRDIKPSNVLLDRDGNAKLGDFGLSNKAGETPDQKFRGTICGTPGFISPELERGEPYNAKSDVWALACTLYELLCLRSAFNDTMEGCFPREVPTFYSAEVCDLLASMLAKDSNQRPQVKDILQMPIVKRYREELQTNVSATIHRPSTQKTPAVEPIDFLSFVSKVKNGDITGIVVAIIDHPKVFLGAAFGLWLFLKLSGWW